MRPMKFAASSLLALSLALAGSAAAYAQQGPPPPPPRGYGPPPSLPTRPGWDAPPSSYRSDVERRAFHEGMEGARKDRGNGRAPNVNNRDEYRRPPFAVPMQLMHSYRRAFSAGYSRGVQYYYGPRRY